MNRAAHLQGYPDSGACVQAQEVCAWTCVRCVYVWAMARSVLKLDSLSYPLVPAGARPVLAGHLADGHLLQSWCGWCVGGSGWHQNVSRYMMQGCV